MIKITHIMAEPLCGPRIYFFLLMRPAGSFFVKMRPAYVTEFENPGLYNRFKPTLYFFWFWQKLFFFSVITNPKVPAGTKDAVKNFSFDFSYWSHDVSTIISLLESLFH